MMADFWRLTAAEELPGYSLDLKILQETRLSPG